jgi:dihydroneopterin aldolase
VSTVPIVEISGLEVFAHHGVLPDEKRHGQPFLFDLRLRCASAEAARSDDLSHAVDYSAVCDRVAELAQGGPYDLLERLADLIARALLEEFPVTSVWVRVRKPQAPIGHPFEHVAVSLEVSADG